MRQGERRRGVAALLLAACLNLALVPCTMALEVVEDRHDCCPPELKLEASECCQLDDVSLDVRGAGKFEPDKDVAPWAPAPSAMPVVVRVRHAVTDPPDPPDDYPDLNTLFCVFLK